MERKVKIEGGISEAKERQPDEIKELWRDKDVVTISFRRHSRYDTERTSSKVGSLTVPGIEEAKKAAKNWTKDLPKDAKVTIYESPSFIPAGERQFPTPHKVLPRRATITASVYEKEIFGRLAPARIDEESGMLQSTRRKQAKLLGDFMEHVTDGKKIPIFYKTRAQIYGSDMPRFWHNFTHGNLDPRLQEALEVCGGSDSLDLAKNMAEFISGTPKEKGTDEKNVILGLTHGETMESFFYQLKEFLETKGRGAEALGEASFSYNEGFDAHLDKGGNLIVVLPDGKNFEVNFREFKGYIDGLSEK